MPSPDIRNMSKNYDSRLKLSAITTAKLLISHYLKDLDSDSQVIVLQAIARLHVSGSWYRVSARLGHHVKALAIGQVALSRAMEGYISYVKQNKQVNSR